MPDITREEFLRGVFATGDDPDCRWIFGPDGDGIARVQGNLGLDLSAGQAASWLVTACNQAARTCATCRYFCEGSGLAKGPMCVEYHPWRNVKADDYCFRWQDKEAADAER